MNKYKRPYLDSSVYLAAIKAETGRVDVVRQILAAADRGDIQLVASTFVAAEVIRVKGEPAALAPESEAKIDKLLKSDRIDWVELDLTLATDARRLSRQHGLKPADAVHMASALRGRADVLLRFDNRFTQDGTLANLDVCDPYWYGDVPLDGFDP